MATPRHNANKAVSVHNARYANLLPQRAALAAFWRMCLTMTFQPERPVVIRDARHMIAYYCFARVL